jgi:hypothetical protein
MDTTIATIGERALRRLGVAIVVVANRPAAVAPIALATIATRALIERDLSRFVIRQAYRPVARWRP